MAQETKKKKIVVPIEKPELIAKKRQFYYFVLSKLTNVLEKKELSPAQNYEFYRMWRTKADGYCKKWEYPREKLHKEHDKYIKLLVKSKQLVLDKPVAVGNRKNDPEQMSNGDPGASS